MGNGVKEKMSTDYISKEIDKIANDTSLEFPLNLAMSSAWILGNLKGVNLKVLDTKSFSSLGDYFIVASASNVTQAQAMAEEVLNQMIRLGYQPKSTEGLRGADWILIDMGDILVHIFLESSRPAYDLENLWTNATAVEIPQDYYFSSDDMPAAKKDDDGSDYF